MEKKLIDHTTLCELVHLQCNPNCDGLINHCPIWRELESVPDIKEMVDKMGVIKAIEEAHNKAGNCNTVFGEKGVESGD